MLYAPYVSYFKIGQQYILQYDQKNGDSPWLSNCGEYYLMLKEGKVYSENNGNNYLPLIGTMALEEFEKKLELSLNRNLSKSIFQFSGGKYINSQKKTKKNDGVNQNLLFILSFGMVFISISFFLLMRKKRNASNN